MLRTITFSLWHPLKSYKTSLLLMFLFLLVNLLLSQNVSSYQTYMPHPEVKASYVIQGISAYLGVVAVSVIINIHRKIIYGHTDRSIRLIPSRIEITYALYLVAMAVVIYLAVFALSFIWVALAVNLPSVFAHIPAIKRDMQPWIYNGLLVIPSLIFIQILIRLYLTFPRVAIDQEKQKWSANQHRQTSIFSKNGLAILVILLLTLAPIYILEDMGRYISKPPELKDIASAGLITLISLIQAYTTIAFATVLSLVYRNLGLAELPDNGEVSSPG